MFVAAPARDREMIETFESLALGFLPGTDEGALIDIARILAPCEDTPASMLDILSRHSPETRSVLLRHGARLHAPADARLLATAEGRIRLVARPDLDATTIERLLVLGESAVEVALAAHPALALADDAMKVLVHRAQDRPALARILLARGDLPPVAEASLYLAALPERRKSIRSRLEASVALQRAALAFRLTEYDVDEFLAASRQGDIRCVERLLTATFGFPETTEWRVLQTGRHPLLALALKAIGFVEREAAGIFLTLHPALSFPLSAIKALVRELREVPAPVALALVEAILGVQALSDGSGLSRRADGDASHRAPGAI
jgi:hypothetical protein